MNKFVKSILTFSISTALGLSAVNAATYQVIDKGAAEKLKYTYSQQENNNGEMALSGTNIYNFPVQFQYLKEADYDAIVSSANVNHEQIDNLGDIEDETALRAGTPTANDLSWVKRYLQGKNASAFYQKVGDVIAMKNFGGETSEFPIFDQKFADTEDFTYSTTDFVNGITDEGWLYGNASAPYMPADFTEDDGDEVTHWIREFSTRGYISPDKGVTIVPIMPPESRYGGESAVVDISDNNIAVGYGSYEIRDAVLARILDDKDGNDSNSDTDNAGGCLEPTELKNTPFELCVQNLAPSMYHTQAYKWQLDESGIVSSEELGHLITLTEEEADEFSLSSFAQAVNSQGVVVGFSTGLIDESKAISTRNQSRYAVMFKDGEVKDFTEDHLEYFDSRAYDINDQGIAVGHAKKVINGKAREKFYYVDTNEETPLMVLPSDFFTGSASSAYAINEHNIIVGDAEVETHNDSNNSPRRTHGFMYDIAADKFTDLNSLLSCNSDYTIIEARDINENNEISATAIIKVARRDSKGQLMTDSSGAQLMEDVVRAVKLSPIAGEVEDCSEVEEKVERQGAGFGLFSIFTLLGLTLTRRLNYKK